MKFKYAIFCYLILGFDTRLHSWLLLFRKSRKKSGLLLIDANGREWLAEWALDIFRGKLDFDSIIKVLAGDEYFDKNKRDILKLEKKTGRSIFELWDTDPIFENFPHLRGLARNKEFEKMWAKIKQKVK